MSNENPELDILDQISDAEEMTSDLRVDDLAPKQTPIEPAKFAFVKPKVHVEGTTSVEEISLTPEQVIAVSKLVEEQTRKAIRESKYNGTLDAQILPKSQTPITDFSKMTMDDVYDLSIPIEAKAFMSADVLKIDLKDSNYEARWVNKNPQNLGDKIAKGFTYITAQDLQSSDAIQTSLDASGHYCFNDVVAMKIDKATYYRALRAAHERAVATTDQSRARQKAAATANSFMSQSDVGSDYRNASVNKKMVFYDPDIAI